MSKRKSITSRTRFEIFKRDSFTCQYCGKNPPQVILHVDHIVPVSENGGFENENLATACADCNLGKSNVPLSSVSQPIKDGLKIERERMHQMALYNKWLLEIREARQMDFMQVSNALMEAAGENPQESRIAGNWATSVRCLLKRLSYVEIVEAVWIANDKFSFQHERYKTFKYFCGICWRKVSANEGTN